MSYLYISAALIFHHLSNRSSDKMVEILDKETGTLPLVALDYPANVDLNHMLSRLAPLLQRLRALIVVAVTPSQLAGLDEGGVGYFRRPSSFTEFRRKTNSDS